MAIIDTKRLQISLIHNHQSDRNGYLIPTLKAFCAALDCSFTMVSWQPPLRPHSLAMHLRRSWRYYRLQLGWAQYRGFGVRHAIGITRTFVRQILIKYGDAGYRTKAKRISQIETLVTAKHIAVWQAFLETDATHLICCEDDLVIKPDSLERMRRLLSGPDLGTGLRYIDLAGGLAVAALGIERLVASRTGDMTIYRPATTNTACCYLLSRALVEHFMAQLVECPELRLIGIDWMMNTMLMRLRAQRIECDALHFDPPIFGHGTFTGDYVSWMTLALDTGAKRPGTTTL